MFSIFAFQSSSFAFLLVRECNIDLSNSTEYFRTVHGFTYLNDESLPIYLPTDNLAGHHIVLHTLLRLAYNGVNVPVAVDQMLRSGGVDCTSGASVLDVATNSGTW